MHRKNMHPWLRFVADESDEQGGNSQSQQQESAADEGKPPQRGPGSDADKPISEMSDAERAAYFEKKANRYRDSLRDYEGVNLDGLRDKASKYDALEYELMSDRDKAVLEAREEAAHAARSELIPRLVEAELRAAAAGKVSPERLAAATEFTDLARFAKDDGSVDADKVEKFVASLGAETPPIPRGPSAAGAGIRSTAGSANSVSAGREAYEQSKKK